MDKISNPDNIRITKKEDLFESVRIALSDSQL